MNNTPNQDDADPLVGFNPLDLFCSSRDTLRGHDIDQFIPSNLGWTSGVGNAAAAAISSGSSGGGGGGGGGGQPAIMTSQPRYTPKSREDMQLLCRRGIPPSLRCAIWIINVVSAANPNMTKRECDEFGTLRKMRVIGKRQSERDMKTTTLMK